MNTGYKVLDDSAESAAPPSAAAPISSYHHSIPPTGPPISAGSSSSSGPSSRPYSGFNSSAFVNPTLAAAAESERVNKYETSLPMRLDVEAATAYLFGAVSGKCRGFLLIYLIQLSEGVLLLVFETKNDYVRCVFASSLCFSRKLHIFWC